MRHVLRIWVIVAYALHSIVPAGFMLAPSADKNAAAMTVVICTGHGPQQDVAADEVPAPSKNNKRDKDICAYASIGSANVDTGPTAVIASQAAYASITYRITRGIFQQTPRPSAHSARGPPQLSLS